MRRTAVILLVVVASCLLPACSSAPETTSTEESTTTAAVESVSESTLVVVPDLVALVGESEFTASNAEASGASLRYGDVDLMEEYAAKAEEAGLSADFVMLHEYEEVFMHGMAGWPVGQDPKPGMQVERGSTVTLILVEMAVLPEPEPSSAGEAYTPERGSAERTAILDGCRLYTGHEGRFIVEQMFVRGDLAVATVLPEDGGEGGLFYLTKNGEWRVTYSMASDGGILDAVGEYVGLSDAPHLEPVLKQWPSPWP